MSTCQVIAYWPAKQPSDRWEALETALREETPTAAAFAQMATGPAWLPELPAFDAETSAAFDAWRRDGLDRVLNDKGISWPETVPLLIDHHGEPLAEFQVDRRGDMFEAFAEVDEATADRISGFRYVSPHLQHRKARLVEIVPELRYVEVTDSQLVEFSAVDNPGLEGTSLWVGKPGSRWVPDSTVAQFSRLHGPDRLSLTFPSSVEVA